MTVHALRRRRAARADELGIGAAARAGPDVARRTTPVVERRHAGERRGRVLDRRRRRSAAAVVRAHARAAGSAVRAAEGSLARVIALDLQGLCILQASWTRGDGYERCARAPRGAPRAVRTHALARITAIEDGLTAPLARGHDELAGIEGIAASAVPDASLVTRALRIRAARASRGRSLASHLVVGRFTVARGGIIVDRLAIGGSAIGRRLVVARVASPARVARRRRAIRGLGRAAGERENDRECEGGACAHG